MTLLSSTEWIVAIGISIIIWIINIRLISSQWLSDLIDRYHIDPTIERNSIRIIGGGRGNSTTTTMEEGDSLLSDGRAPQQRQHSEPVPAPQLQPPSQSMDRRLAMTYEMIFGPFQSLIESDSSRIWFWIILAFLINVVCIRIELLMFQDMIATAKTSNSADDFMNVPSNSNANTTSSTSSTTTSPYSF